MTDEMDRLRAENARSYAISTPPQQTDITRLRFIWTDVARSQMHGLTADPELAARLGGTPYTRCFAPRITEYEVTIPHLIAPDRFDGPAELIENPAWTEGLALMRERGQIT